MLMMNQCLLYFERVCDMDLDTLQDWLDDHVKGLTIAVIIVSVLLVASLIVYNVTVGGMKATMNEQSQQIFDLKNSIETKKNEAVSKQTKVSEGVSYFDGVRFDTDRKVFDSFIKDLLAASDQTSYDKIRSNVMMTYGLTEDSLFVQTLLPVGYPGNRLYITVDPYVSAINDSKYSYFTYLTYEQTDSAGNKSLITHVLTYRIDGNGVLSDLILVNVS